jgi:hypothetical protein
MKIPYQIQPGRSSNQWGKGSPLASVQTLDPRSHDRGILDSLQSIDI